MKLQKQKNLELLRIIAMLMIITLHVLGHGGVLKTVVPKTIPYYLSWTIEGICFIGVNCYVLISGYFLIDSTFNLKKLFRLLLQVLFFSAGFYILLCFTGHAEFTPLNLIKAFTPVISSEYWFVTIYVGMYVLSPFINIFIKSLTKQQHMLCILLAVFLFSILPTFLFYSPGLNFGSGIGIVWFSILYLIAAYIKKYYKPTYKIKNYVIPYIFVALLVPLSKFIIELSSSTFVSKILSDDSIRLLTSRLYEYNSILVLIASLFFFLIFLNIKNSSLNGFILKISPLCFGVYLIHDNTWFSKVIWSTLNPSHYSERWYFILFLIVTVVSLFILCALIERIRQFLFSKTVDHLQFNKVTSLLNQKKDDIIQKLTAEK